MDAVLKSLRKDVVALFVSSFVLLILMMLVSYWSSLEVDKARAQLTRSNKVILALESLISNVKDVETGVRGYVLTSRQSYLTPYFTGQPAAVKNMQSLYTLVRIPSIKKELTTLDTLLQQRISISRKIVAIQDSKGSTTARQVIEEGHGKQVMDQLRKQVEYIKALELDVSRKADVDAARSTAFTRIFYTGAFVLVFVMQLLACYIIIREMLQRKEAEEKVLSLNKDLELHINDLAVEIAERTNAENKIIVLNRELEVKLDLLNETNTTLNAVNHELESFAYSVSHDLRAPLRGIDGFSLALIEDYGDKIDNTGKEYLQRVRHESQRMGQLIDGILNLSRLTRGDINKSHVKLSQVAEKIMGDLKKQEPERKVDYKIEPGLEADADPRLIEPALENLLNNAWKFTSKKPAAVIEFGSRSEDGKTVYFVKDNGAGFDMAHVNKLFGPFQRLHGMTEYKGTGIGLATVQRIINRHGGHIWADAKVNEGAMFSFTLN